MNLTDFDIFYKNKPIKNILMATWVDMPNGFTAVDGAQEFIVMIKIAFINDEGKLTCIEDIAKNFTFADKSIDL